ncbi:MAG: 30S ribosomal protein S3 [Anaerolineae bacterium]|nr:30S ribosomal protein S3 [Anaerolineae bacterium]MDK1080880.1 30S ribosomal protein S3 [Anaerolineae bacterium]MDK1118893.1 30S ribosomal protein S3 [Anaerolineae bacterium]
MGRKVHPIGMRLGVNETWQGRWFAEGAQYRQQLHQDLAVRSLLEGIPAKGGGVLTEKVRKLRTELPEPVLKNRAGVSRIEIERFPGKIRVAIHTAKPGVLIGRKGESVKKIRAGLETLIGKKVDLDIKEIDSPDIDAKLVALNIADQLKRRIAYRRAMKRAIQQAMRSGAQGIKIMVSGRLSGAEMARTVWLRDGRVPLQTLRAKIDFSVVNAITTFGTIGVKVWIYLGESMPEVEEIVDTTEGVYVSE